MSIYRTVGSGGSFGASPLEQHIGLGKSARISQIEDLVAGNEDPANFANVEQESISGDKRICD